MKNSRITLAIFPLLFLILQCVSAPFFPVTERLLTKIGEINKVDPPDKTYKLSELHLAACYPDNPDYSLKYETAIDSKSTGENERYNIQACGESKGTWRVNSVLDDQRIIIGTRHPGDGHAVIVNIPTDSEDAWSFTEDLARQGQTVRIKKAFKHNYTYYLYQDELHYVTLVPGQDPEFSGRYGVETTEGSTATAISPPFNSIVKDLELVELPVHFVSDSNIAIRRGSEYDLVYFQFEHSAGPGAGILLRPFHWSETGRLTRLMRYALAVGLPFTATADLISFPLRSFEPNYILFFAVCWFSECQGLLRHTN